MQVGKFKTRGDVLGERLSHTSSPAIVAGMPQGSQPGHDEAVSPLLGGPWALYKLRDDAVVPLICPTCQVFAGSLKTSCQRLLLLCMGLFSIFRPLHACTDGVVFRHDVFS